MFAQVLLISSLDLHFELLNNKRIMINDNQPKFHTIYDIELPFYAESFKIRAI